MVENGLNYSPGIVVLAASLKDFTKSSYGPTDEIVCITLLGDPETFKINSHLKKKWKTNFHFEKR